MPEQLYVVIATHNRNELLQRTLDSLSQCNLPDCYVGTLVIENGGKFGTDTVVESCSDDLHAKYLYLEQGNKSAALNFALESIPNQPGVLVYFTDDDVRFESSLLQKLASAAENVPSGEFYVGPMEADYQECPPDWLATYLPTSVRGWNPHIDDHQATHPTRIQHGGLGLGCNWAAYVRDLHSAGLFDPDYGPGSESGATGQESDMMTRLLNSRVESIFVPHATVWHNVPANRCDTSWTLRRGYRRALQIGRKCTTPFRTTALDLLRILFWGLCFPVFYPIGGRYRFRMMYGFYTAVGRLSGIWKR